MKKLLFSLPVVVLLAAGCNSSRMTTNQPTLQVPVAQTTLTSTPTPTPSPSPTSTPDRTANWKIYKSSTSQYYKNVHPSFSFKYPSDWYLGYQGGGDDLSVSVQSLPWNVMGDYPSTMTSIGIELNPTFSDPKAYCSKGKLGITFSNGKSFQVNGYPAYSQNYTMDGYQGNYIEVCIGGGAGIIVEGSQDELAIFNQVVNTIRFGQ